ncbi:hypothetical protein CNECB9_1190018 [Cupriavidus necator]|uniref:Uncharacterized protein n=1 Tax=Cupriavidus necator TaxID=106590 RepID=A0A1K0I8U3_CUPNE|nr:hypothetical protein CNECB9_1190018 [Cupriavidus necator]
MGRHQVVPAQRERPHTSASLGEKEKGRDTRLGPEGLFATDSLTGKETLPSDEANAPCPSLP